MNAIQNRVFVLHHCSSICPLSFLVPMIIVFSKKNQYPQFDRDRLGSRGKNLCPVKTKFYGFFFNIIEGFIALISKVRFETSRISSMF